MTQLDIESPKHCTAKQPHNSHHHHRHSFINSSSFWKLLSTLFSALLTVILLVWLVLRPSKPSFSLQQASVYHLSLSDSVPAAASFLNSSFQLTFVASNPNSRLGIYYDSLRVYASYQGQQITGLTSFPPFYQDHGEKNLLSASLTGSNLPVAPYFGSEVARDQVSGKLTVRFAVDGRIRWKVGKWVSGKYRMNVECITAMDFGRGLPAGPLTSQQGSRCSTTL
ncbi:hypothetical protein MLD38_015721 [Melastoma candidum]|uniref:Uncharacterized protein n=1 Tax=Melastoma candidum TaxID=119954 RepID=A0ACB9RGX9_9MYRT|nr:hypothetical protein MLD38_015721 [Melastoma candidum]